MAASIRVLHVEDDDLAEVTAEFLERECERIEVLSESDPREGLDRVLSDGVDCVVSDYDMPEMDGIELLERVRAADGDVPFILFTGKGSEEVASEALSKGATDYLQKEVGADQYAILANRIENAVRQRRTVAELERQGEVLREAQDIAELGVCEYDLENGEAWFSEGMYRLFGLDPEADRLPPVDVDLEAVLEFYHPADRSAVEGTIERALDAGEARDLEVRLAGDADAADERWVRLRVRPQVVDGDVRRFRATVQDVTETKAREQELRRTERRFEAVFEDPDQLVGLLDVDGTLLDCNETALAYVDEGREQLRGEPFPETPWWVDEVRADVREWIERAADGEYVTYEADHTRPDGETYTVSGSIRPVREDGEVVSLIVAAHDMTRRRSNREERAFFEALVAETTDVITVVEADGSVQYANPAIRSVLGHDPADLTGESIVDYIHPEDREAAVTWFERFVSGPETGTEAIEYRARHADGSWRWLESTAQNGAETPLSGFVIASRDVTERKERERELTEYRTILRMLPDEVAVVDTDGYFTRVIPPGGSETTTSGRVAGDLEGKHVSDVLSEESVERGTALIEELLRTDRERGVIEHEVRTADGECRVREDHVALLEDEDGSIQGSVGVFRDIEERKAYERELERQNERLEAFAEIASHDLRNPLNLAQGHLDLVGEDCDSEHVGKVEAALERMERLIEDTLTMARGGTTVSERSEVDLGTLAPGCWDAVGTEDGTLTVVDSVTVLADESRLKQLLENLLRNAVEHGSTSPPSQAREDAVEHGSTSPPSQSQADAVEHEGDGVTVTIGATAEGDGFYVADDGPGVPPDEREAVFDAGYTTDSEGTGFGLAIVGEIAEAHGWDLAVTESEAGGARFEVTGMNGSSR